MKTLTIASLLCLSAATGFAQCTVNHVSVHKEARMSSAVVVATVTAATPVPEAWDFLDGVNYTVHVEQKLHGKAHANKDMVIFSEHVPNEFQMQVGEKYVLYLQPKYDRYQVNTCGNSHATDEILTAKQTKPATASGF